MCVSANKNETERGEDSETASKHFSALKIRQTADKYQTEREKKRTAADQIKYYKCVHCVPNPKHIDDVTFIFRERKNRAKENKKHKHKTIVKSAICR